MAKKNDSGQKPVLVSGATGYLAGRLIPLLLESGRRVRAMGRFSEKMADRPWASHPNLETARADIRDFASLEKAMKGCGAVFHLVHSMSLTRNRLKKDRVAARHMARAAARVGAERIIYLGGLGDVSGKRAGAHLRSRHEAGDILRQGPVPATLLRAAMILGSGGAAFEIIQFLAERRKTIPVPGWADAPLQPISIANVLFYLKECLDHPETAGRAFDIGGPDRTTFRDLIGIFADAAGLPRPRMVRVPFLPPWLWALFIHLSTPVPAVMARPILEGLAVPAVCRERDIQKLIPQRLIGCREAMDRALDKIRKQEVETRWADAGRMNRPQWLDAPSSGRAEFQCGYRADLKGDPLSLWRAAAGLGGETGYYAGDVLWKIRGLMDLLAGGFGLGRGRRSPSALHAGDALDFWRVLESSPPSRIVLLAEMKVPGEAVLEIDIKPVRSRRLRLSLLARFAPRGAAGAAYWFALYPFHQYLFTNMIKGMARAAGLEMVSRPRKFAPKPGRTTPRRPGPKPHPSMRR
ncbi:conserved hypothetical protein [Candidatus Desulfarcum epimagneticum]|uniref:NAD(P)-binding domain-containing protein n=1 Tax=uncultured Desulfobacteraceae bacterium TaxID=218296 RepID=A0A484HM28_9BACT|nr:conserved hypothetical protein [uncultured Desulfobacteraceae bacterium]